MLDEEIMTHSFDERSKPAGPSDFARITYFGKSNAFGFGSKEDYQLGRMAE
jgi:hypothetical protein